MRQSSTWILLNGRRSNLPETGKWDGFLIITQVRNIPVSYTHLMETLQGLSISELSSVEGRKWRTVYSDPENTKRKGLDDTVWPEAFERMEQFIQDTGLSQEDLNMNYDDVVEMYKSGKLAMYFGSSFGVKMFQDQGINTTFLPFFQENGEKWIMTTPYFQVALNRDLTKDETRRKKAMEVLDTMFSEEMCIRDRFGGI